MELINVLTRRQSVRRFTDDPVPEQVCAELLAAAVLAPSPHGRQPWRFVVIEHGHGRETLVDAMTDEWRTQLQHDSLDESHIETRINASTSRIRQAPLLIMPCVNTSVIDVYPDSNRQHAEYLMAVQSMGCAIQNILLRAVDLGYDAGWMCAPLFCQDTVRRALQLEQTDIPQALIPVGRLAVSPKRRAKRPYNQLMIRR
ncbi:MAG: nitroreductase family protein [Chloroflexota bacterium]|jgi:coenzyme F420-0:L-glutamate ligase/coenzyme F420-1:gamma-L-glutamate ligase